MLLAITMVRMIIMAVQSCSPGLANSTSSTKEMMTSAVSNADKRIDKSFDESRYGVLFLLMFHFVLPIERLSGLHFFLCKSDTACLEIAENCAQCLTCC